MVPPIDFDSMYIEHYAMLHRLAYQWYRSSEEADDTVQEVFADIWLKRDSLKIKTTLAAYLVGVLRNKLRHNMRHHGVVGRNADVWTALGESPALGEKPDSPDIAAEKSELITSITRAVLSFPPRQKMAMLLHWQDGLSASEVAEVMEISDRVARKLLQVGMEKLKNILPV